MLKFVADLHSDSGLLPGDPIQRAHVRFFTDAVSNKLTPQWAAFFLRGEAPDKFIEAVAKIQDLPSQSGFAVGDHFTIADKIADAATAPFLDRWEPPFRNDIGKFAERGKARTRGAERTICRPAEILCGHLGPPKFQE